LIMKILSGKYILPTWICAGFFLILILWVSYLMLVSYSVKCECIDNIDKAVESVIENALASGILREKDMENQVDLLRANFKKIAQPDFDDMSGKINLITYLFIIGSIAILFTFLSWTYAIRNRELMARLDAVLSKKELVDELGLAAAGLAHETKNPLGVIRGLAQNIADNSENNSETRKKAREIMEETDVTTARLGDFLSYARFRSPVPEEINSVDFLERICGLMKDDFDNAGVELRTELSPVIMMADKDMLSQILVNLMTNSLRFTKKGNYVTLSCQSRNNRFADLEVSDTGKGIEPKLLPDVFKPYVTKGAGGYGIGLAIVKRIVDQAGWKISLNSKENVGTTIAISNIPIKSDT